MLQELRLREPKRYWKVRVIGRLLFYHSKDKIERLSASLSLTTPILLFGPVPFWFLAASTVLLVAASFQITRHSTAEYYLERTSEIYRQYFPEVSEDKELVPQESNDSQHYLGYEKIDKTHEAEEEVLFSFDDD